MQGDPKVGRSGPMRRRALSNHHESSVAIAPFEQGQKLMRQPWKLGNPSFQTWARYPKGAYVLVWRQ